MFLQSFKFSLKTTKREEFIQITDRISDYVKESGAMFGTCKIFVPHTTAGITINEKSDPELRRDFINILNELIPHQRRFIHSEGNSDAHFKSSLIGTTIEIPIENGALDLGQWQGIFFCEFDGPRTRTVKVMIFAEGKPRA